MNNKGYFFIFDSVLHSTQFLILSKIIIFDRKRNLIIDDLPR